jgi:glycosyltransferase involved in cell wall biosynthesis
MFLSVALCTYNGESFLEQQLNSILDQTIQVNEIVVCDDGSSDNTMKLLKTYKKNFPNIIKLFTNNVTLGTIKNFEQAISFTKGDLIFLADQDDIWHKDKVEIMSRFFQENSNCKLLFSDGNLIDEMGYDLNSTLWEKWGFNTDLQNKWKININAFKDLVENHNKITGATVCFHKSLKNTIIPIELPYGYWHDAWLGIHASAVYGLMYIDKSLINYRIHDKQQVGIPTDVISKTLKKSDINYIEKSMFFKNIIKLYPQHKNNISFFKNQKIKIKIFKKIRNIYIRLFQRK